MKLWVKLSPNAKREGVVGVIEDDGRKILRIAVRAPAIEGKANAALVRFLSDIFHIPKSRVEVASGLTSKYKTVMIDAEITADLEKIFNDY